MEDMVRVDPAFWKGKRVFLTGHTGFKGSWLSIWLLEMGAEVFGFSKDIPTRPSLFEKAGLKQRLHHKIGDVRDSDALTSAMQHCNPEVVIHMAAQPLVRYSYKNPLETLDTNIMGTARVLDACRNLDALKSVVIVTTDKCYENREWVYGYRENDPMGGFDPYSCSKGAAELVVASYNRSFFENSEVMVCSARAGNVIGGGDWAEDRLVPDVVESIRKGKQVAIRNPLAIRPWQHVLEPLSGYLLLAEQGARGEDVRGGWNFGPNEEDARNVQWLTEEIGRVWGMEEPVWYKDGDEHPHEARYLKLDSSKARMQLKWKPVWNAAKAVRRCTLWYKDYYQLDNEGTEAVYSRCLEDIHSFKNLNIHQHYDRRINQAKVQRLNSGVLSG